MNLLCLQIKVYSIISRIESSMGNKCKQVCSNPVNQSSLSFQLKSERPWVRKLNLSKAQKVVVAVQDQNEPERAYYVLHDGEDYLKGVIFTHDSFYEGQIDQGHMAKGKGLQKIQLNEGELHFQGSYEGNFDENARNGHGVYRDSCVKFEGQWKNGYPIKGVLENIDPLHNSKGPKHKKYIVEQITFNNTEMSTGTTTIVLPDGSKYIGEFVREKNNRYSLQGRGILYFTNSDVFDGQFKDGKFHGEGTYTSGTTGKRFYGLYKAGFKNGPGKLYLDNGRLLQGKWVNNKKQGKFTLSEAQANGNAKVIGQLLFKDDIIQQK